ncbi:tyrosine--tRNA ligase [Frankia sp. CcI49]|uniref:tyrosine--tRNA ligase n=1 Tax=unclassified Frankia TaxID=2632575 RepID=UPI0006CA4BE1|nr:MULTISPECIES: tyrosine--tRNA ligase [unclassified Frankia]KPM54031.1 tyrosyl-tRNA synthetase [Frankia sp. R43]ONH61446.1 tyrosine--tRNA ligase [Frankia sp. CcI49]
MSVINDRAHVDRLLSEFARTTDEILTLEELRTRLLSGRQLIMKYGVDLTAPHLHIGHAVNLWMYRALQDLGHRVVLLLGDFTTQIGDPTGKSKTRPVLAREEIEANAKQIQEQATRVLRTDPELLEIRPNSEWLNAMTPSELLTVMSRVTVDRLLSRDMFRKRMSEGQSIAAHELVYPIIQGWDSVCLRADLTIIGSDQLFNEMMGRSLQEKEGQAPQVVITTKITPGIDGGEKQSKSLGNYVAINHSPREKFGRLMRVPDQYVGQYLTVYSDLPEDAIRAVLSKQETAPIEAKYDMATAIVTRWDGEAAAAAERDWFITTFSRRQVPADAEHVVLDTASMKVLDLMRTLLGAGPSNGDLRRLIQQGGVTVGDDRIDDTDAVITVGSEPVPVKLGKRRWFQVSHSPAD